MKNNFNDLTGKKFERLSVTGMADRSKYKIIHWECACECGNKTEVRTNYLLSGHSRSCGCRTIDVRTTHGMSRTRQYRIYKAMIARCYKATTVNFNDYGGRGITVCKEWMESFEKFWEDMKESYSDALSIDRIDNEKGYSKENCKWSTRNEQNSNTRRNRILELNGEIKTMREWAKSLGVNEKSLSWRIRNGWSDTDILTTPMTYKNKKYRKSLSVS